MTERRAGARFGSFLVGLAGLVPLVLVPLISAFAVPSAVAAQTGSPLWQRWGVSVGSYFNFPDSKVRADAEESVLGTDIDFEGDLGLKSSSTSARLRVDRLFGRRHELSLGAFELNRSASRTITRDLEFENTVFPASATVRGELDTRNIQVAYSYYVVHRDRLGVGLSTGIVDFRAAASLAATVEVAGVRLTLQEGASTTLPIPMIGARLRGLPHPRIVLLAEARHLPSIQVGDIDGSSSMASLALEGRLARHVRLGVSYDFFEIDASVTNGAFTGRVKWTEEGSQLYLRFAW
jgi:hypothetical protein